MGGGVKSCDLTDPYAVILLADGTVALLELCDHGGGDKGGGVSEGKEGDGRLKLTWPDLQKVCMYSFLKVRSFSCATNFQVLTPSKFPPTAGFKGHPGVCLH